MRNFIGRHEYLKNLETHWKDSSSKIVGLYGRRRVGKSQLVKEFAKNKQSFLFEALEAGNTQEQVRHFLKQLATLCDESHLAQLNFTDWPAAFDLLTQKMAQHKKLVLFFDELPWMACGRKKLVSHIKYYWDNHWKNHPHLLFILCGSVASWMVHHVIKSQALYGRISESILLAPLCPSEVLEFIGKKRGQREVLEYLLCFGGIPRYLEEFDFNQSLQININRTCFKKTGFFVDEYEKIFYNQFKEASLYKKITNLFQKGPLSLEEIAKLIKMPSGGGLKNYVSNLVSANILESIPVISNFNITKSFRYVLSDEYLKFYASYIGPFKTEILKNMAADKFEKITRNTWNPFLGLAFERLCNKYRYEIGELLGFGQKILGCGSIYHHKKNGYQFDLVYLRNDSTITLCEIKYLNHPMGTSIIAEFESKIARTQLPKKMSVEKVLICSDTPQKALIESGYFHRILTAREIIENI